MTAPEKSCACGDPSTKAIHCTDGSPCYVVPEHEGGTGYELPRAAKKPLPCPKCGRPGTWDCPPRGRMVPGQLYCQLCRVMFDDCSIHPARLAAEGLVRAEDLEEVEQALEKIQEYSHVADERCRTNECPAALAKAALAHLRALRGKG